MSSPKFDEEVMKMETTIINFDIKVVAKVVGLQDTDILSFRPNGKLVADYIQYEVSKLAQPGKCIISFKDVLICDISFIDEVIINTIDYIKDKELNIQLLVSDADDDIEDNIHAAILLRMKKEKNYGNIKYSIHVLCLSKTGLELMGDIETNLEETFEIVKGKKEITARELTEVIDLPINSASNRLKKLYDMRLILRVMLTDIEGKYYKYFI